MRVIPCITFILLLFSSWAFAKPIGTINVEGVDSKTAKVAREIIRDAVSPNYNIDDLDVAAQNLYSTDLFNGIEIYSDEQDGKINLTFKLSPVRTIKNIIFVGNSSYSSSALFSELGFYEGESYSEEKVVSGVERVKKFYNLNGFLAAQVIVNMIPVADSANLVVKVDIKEGKPCLVEKFSFQTPNVKLNGRLSDLVKKYVLTNFSQNLLNVVQTEVQQFLVDENYISAVLEPPVPAFNADRTRVTLQYSITDPYMYGLVFEGNNAFTEQKITKELKIDVNNRLSNTPVEDLTERVLKFYKKNGYANVSVKAREVVSDVDFSKRINFTIDEGSKVKIKDILMDGSYSRPPKYYKNFIFDHSGDIVGKGLYNSEDFDDGVKNLVTELQNQGFLAAKIPSVRVDFDKLKEYATIKLTVDEGPQTFIQSIAFKGLQKISKNEIESTIGLKAGVPLQLNALSEASNKIADLYKSKGYLDAQVTNQGKSIVTYSADNTKASLVFDIYEGPLVTVSSIVVEGNSFTKRYVILRELQFKPGDVLTPENLSYSETRLQRLSLFNSVDIRVIGDDPREGNRSVLVQVIERDPGLFKSGVGLDNEFILSIKGFIGAAYRNLFGTGRAINARAEVNDRTQYNFIEHEITFGYTEPFVFGTENTAKINLTDSNKLFEIRLPQVFAVSNLQGDLVFERDLSRYLKLIFEGYGFAHTNTYDIYGNVPATPLDIATTGPTLIFDRRDNLFNPTTGDISTFSFEFSSPYMGSTQTVNYYKTIGSFTKYISFGKLVFANEGKAGFLRNISPQANGAIPQIKDFLLGGRSTVRGFNPVTEAFPQLQEIVGPNNLITTESFFFLAKSELRFPISGNFGAAVFYDGGQVGSPEYKPHFNWRDSVGIGLRYITPVGPVSFEYGQKLNRDDSRSAVGINEAPGFFYFSIGVF